MLWTAPSWSWASRNWPVSFDDSYTSSLFEHKSIEFCELVSAECVLAGESKQVKLHRATLSYGVR